MKQETVKFTQEQLNNFNAYRKVQMRGKYNMFDSRAIAATKLTQNEYAFVMDNYGELKLASLENLP
jgi:hypothetical protein